LLPADNQEKPFKQKNLNFYKKALDKLAKANDNTECELAKGNHRKEYK